MEIKNLSAANRLQPGSAFDSGSFFVGCNYWASHAGTAMWSDWRPEIVEQDLEQLSHEGLQVLRVFPLWPDFQPLTALYSGHGRPHEYRFGEDVLPADEAGQAGVSAEMMARFRVFADVAEKNHLKLIVGLLTGWMSGRLFVPPALEGKNVLSDPTAILWETRFVKYFVRQFQQHPSILAWDLGNECNCMAPLPDHETAWAWSSAIGNAIRAEDPSHLIVSGMHSLEPGKRAVWTMQDQGELMDVLTTHPYPYFTPHCDQDPVNTIRNLLHATSESRFYADIGGKPCLAEEVGTLGPMIASEAIAADYVRTILFSLWAHDCHGLLWWCSFDQILLEHAPYDWASFERELGLVRVDRTARPVLKEIGKFGQWVCQLPFKTLPLRSRQAVCILTEDQDQWGAAYGSFVLARQAGFDIEYQFANQPLKDASLYLLPSVKGGGSFSRRLWFELMERAEQGADVYLSHDDCMLSPFNRPFGLEVQTRQKRSAPAQFALGGDNFHLASPIQLKAVPTGAEVLAAEPDGNPVFTCHAYGKGHFFFLSVPVERVLSETPSAFHGPDAQPFWKIYACLASARLAERVVSRDLPEVGVTEHALDESQRVIVAINYSPAAVSPQFQCQPGWQPGASLYGPLLQLSKDGWIANIPANDAIVFLVTRS
jgi:hypothetical protein